MLRQCRTAANSTSTTFSSYLALLVWGSNIRNIPQSSILTLAKVTKKVREIFSFSILNHDHRIRSNFLTRYEISITFYVFCTLLIFFKLFLKFFYHFLTKCGLNNSKHSNDIIQMCFRFKNWQPLMVSILCFLKKVKSLHLNGPAYVL